MKMRQIIIFLVILEVVWSTDDRLDDWQCPNECSKAGICFPSTDGTPYCKCVNGFSGKDCSILTTEESPLGDVGTPSSPTAPSRAAAATIPPAVSRSTQSDEVDDFKLTFATSYPTLVWILVASLVVNLVLVSCLCRAYRKNSYCC